MHILLKVDPQHTESIKPESFASHPMYKLQSTRSWDGAVTDVCARPWVSKACGEFQNICVQFSVAPSQCVEFTNHFYGSTSVVFVVRHLVSSMIIIIAKQCKRVVARFGLIGPLVGDQRCILWNFPHWHFIPQKTFSPVEGGRTKQTSSGKTLFASHNVNGGENVKSIWPEGAEGQTQMSL